MAELKRQILIAETIAVRERGLRQRQEDDIRRMLLKNMTSMNVEAILALKQPLLYPTEDEDQTYALTYDEETLRDAMAMAEKDSLNAYAAQLQIIEENQHPNINTIAQTRASSKDLLRSSFDKKPTSTTDTSSTTTAAAHTQLSSSQSSVEVPRSAVPVPTRFTAGQTGKVKPGTVKIASGKSTGK